MTAHAWRDSATMTRRNLRRTMRYPVTAASVVLIPVVLLLMFVYAFGDTMGAGLAGPSGGRSDYLEFVVPGIILIAIAGSSQGTAISVAMDMADGIVARFRTMAIARSSVLAGHVAGNGLQTMLGLAVVLGVAVAIGFRPTATPVEWLAAAALLGLATVAFTWLSVGCGLVTKSVEAASNLPLPLILLPFLGSGFVPTETMPGVLGWFAEHQPFTPIMDTLRGLLLGTAIGSRGAVAVAWCVVIGVGGYLWSRKLYDRDPSS